MTYYQFEVDKICNYLQPLKNQLAELYQWNANIDRLEDLKVFTKEQIQEIITLSPYQKELRIKEAINSNLTETYKLSDKKQFYDLCLWIIKDWGGILTAKDEGTIQLINDFVTSENKSYERIASSSKVGSFMSPPNYIIYDSRVAYSLNWILLSETNSSHFFPIPDGRNSKMMAFEMSVLIRLKNVNLYKSKSPNDRDNRLFINNKDKQIYIPKKESYKQLNQLIKQVNNKLWADNPDKKDKLFFTEMLLFSIADKQIYDDITNRVQIKI